ncbi:Gfo/Idh/MocA family protein [Frigoriglobus tundricola]|uniref:Alpha-N-acetylgalactosaminidase n=1 Tax=Frigoriglobus tundricola TaxID=2774151 RepID=A0A6M5YPM9_9BACT|nr:Gfo/Idh/MocA family oxidoreductase [Frigoriglobus tundricola]QJW95253.1 Alpha-N-acetylgalactosaminidase [Frigoriglobus tundricola]
MLTTRREFLATSALTLSAASYTRAADKPNEKVRVAVMGLRVRGKQLAPLFAGVPGVELTHLVDPDPAVVKPTLDVLKALDSPPKIETDVRKVLDDKTVTAIVVSAPDHWHALATLWAAERGKHVYVEKPVSHNLIEGRRMVAAARKYRVVIQAGTQRRSSTSVAAAREYVQSGKLGRVAFARAWIAGGRPNIGYTKPEAPPKGVDYSLWLGPADGAFTKNRFHYNWHWFWDLGTGEIGNNGIHGLDAARNILGVDAPTKISCSGGKYYYDDDQQTPDTQIATFDFPTGPGGAAGCTLVWEHRVWEQKGQGPEGQSFGVSVHGDKGTMLFTNDAWQIRGGDGAAEKPKGDMVTAHVSNFVAAVRGTEKPSAEIEIGHTSTRLCHLGNIAYRTGKTLKFDAKTETTDDPAANALLGRAYRKGFELPAV